MGIINFNKGVENREKIVQKKIDNTKKEVDLLLNDICDILQDTDYGDVLESNLDGMIIVLDFNTNEVSTELFINTKEGENNESED